MKTYEVDYYLGDMFHGYLVDAKSEYEATMKVLNSIPDTSKDIFHDFKIKIHSAEWN